MRWFKIPLLAFSHLMILLSLILNKLVCWYSFNYDWYESVVCSADLWTLSI